MFSEQQASHGLKVWLRVRGDMTKLVLAPSTSAITDVSPQGAMPDGDTLCLAFGPDASRLDPTDTNAVSTAVADLIPDHEVLDTYSHDWTADEFSRGTWSSYRPGQLSRCLTDLQHPEDRVFLAGSDIASGWNGNIDGAIESGIIVARRVARRLATAG